MNRSNIENNSIEIQLQDYELWQKFFYEKNEMVVTKAGRRMFPVVRLKMKGLDPNSMYNVALVFVPIDEYKWRFMNGFWFISGSAESQPSQDDQRTYIHSESPNFGSHWMSKDISFAKVKLTNKCNKTNGVVLNSLHRYQTRIVVDEIRPGCANRTVATIDFPVTAFYAVTAYQSDEVKNLKIKHNPHAKSFNDPRRRAWDAYTHENDTDMPCFFDRSDRSGVCNQRSPSNLTNEEPEVRPSYIFGQTPCLNNYECSNDTFNSDESYCYGTQSSYMTSHETPHQWSNETYQMTHQTPYQLEMWRYENSCSNSQEYWK
ncbi:T-related protein-like [Centruroides vittatus]|uniref:T-related protein-like n=1 Tax=Centruroides vittatus TaxID=120091 RepID=UPI00350F1DF2